MPSEQPPTRVERRIINQSMWAVYVRENGADDRWSYRDTVSANEPDTAARVVAATHWTGGQHDLLAVGIEGAYEYRVTVESSGPVV